MELRLAEELICYCNSVSKREIEQAIQNGATTLKKIQDATGACTGNRCAQMNPKGICCSGDILKLLPVQQTKCNCCK